MSIKEDLMKKETQKMSWVQNALKRTLNKRDSVDIPLRSFLRIGISAQMLEAIAPEIGYDVAVINDVDPENPRFVCRFAKQQNNNAI
jgi:hypothetical protein